MAIEPEFIAVQPDDAVDDGWETEEDEDEVDDDVVENHMPFNDHEVWENLGEWAGSLFRDDMKKIAVLLVKFYMKLRPRLSVTSASNAVSNFMQFSGKSIRKCRKQYMNNRGDFNEYGRGKYQRESLMFDDHFCTCARNWARENANRRGQPNMTVHDFRDYVNHTLLPDLQKGRDNGIFRNLILVNYLFISYFYSLFALLSGNGDVPEATPSFGISTTADRSQIHVHRRA